jgi:hypothetical protein
VRFSLSVRVAIARVRHRTEARSPDTSSHHWLGSAPHNNVDLEFAQRSVLSRLSTVSARGMMLLHPLHTTPPLLSQIMQVTGDLQLRGAVAHELLEVTNPWTSPAPELSALEYGVASSPSLDSSSPLSPLLGFQAAGACSESCPRSSPFSWSGTPTFPSSCSTSSVTADDCGGSTPQCISASSASPHLVPERSHRRIDASRRSKEITSLRRLERLTGIAPDRLTKRGKLKKRTAASKLAVLEASADKLERLQSLLNQMARESHVREQRVQQLKQRLQHVSDSQVRGTDSAQLVPCSSPLSSPLSLLPPAAARYICMLDNRQALYDTFFLHNPLAMLLLDLERPVEAGQLLDANESAAVTLRIARAIERSASPATHSFTPCFHLRVCQDLQ